MTKLVGLKQRVFRGGLGHRRLRQAKGITSRGLRGAAVILTVEPQRVTIKSDSSVGFFD
ncbi:MAG: hypothetical protein LPK02_04905 [Rhodobacterales bacterium]|nr:hypothetical protein [Rhodobacterales bacterium]